MIDIFRISRTLRPIFSRAILVASLVAASSCGTQINTLRNAAKITAGATGVPPGLTSFVISETSPTKSFPLTLAYGLEVGTHTQYCILENGTNPNACVWRSGALPTSYFDSSPDGPLALTLFLKNANGISDAVTSNTVTIDRTPPALASATVTNSDPTNTTTFSLAYGAVTGGGYSDYCILENSTSVAGCGWQSGTLPSSFVVSATNGPKDLYIWLRDTAGNVSFPVHAPTVTLNLSVPTVAITSPAAGSFVTAANAASFAVSGTCSENGRNVVISGAASATVACAGGAWSTTLNFTAAADGTVTIYADHSNSAGTAASQASRSFTKDVVVPTVAITSPAAGSAVNAANKSAFAISGTCSENGRNVVISGAASATVACAGGAWSTTLDLSAAADGVVTVYADHSDAAGNPAVQASRSFVKDVVVPTVAITSPAAGSYVNNANKAAFAISGTCSENGRNVVISGAASTTVACAGGAWSTTLDLSAAADGGITVYADHADAGGNPAVQASRSFNKDVVVPTVAITSPAAGSLIGSANVASFTVTGTCSENGANVVVSGAASATVICLAGAWTANLDFSSAAEGSATILVNHADAAGNNATQDSRTFTKDTGVPTVAITSPAAGTWANAATQSSFTVSGTCSENGQNVVLSGAASATVACTAGAWTANLDVSGAADGAITVTANHSDAAANAAAPASRGFNKDVSAPTANLLTPSAAGIALAGGSTYNVTWTASDGGSGVDHLVVRYSTDNGATYADATTSAPNTGTYAWTVPSSDTSTAFVRILVNDVAGNVQTKTSTNAFTIDSTAPTVAITSPAAGSYANNSNKAAFAVSGTCSENGRNVVISGAGSATATCTAGAWSTTVDVSAAADGTITLYADHSDAAGNAATQASRTFTKDTVNPTVAITSPAAGSSIYTVNMTTFAVSGTCSENGRTVTLSGAASGTATCTAGAWSANLDFSGASDGAVTLYADLSDAAGNVATQASRSFNKDTGVPTLTISSPAAGSYVNAANVASFTVSGTCSENGQNVVISGDASATVACSSGAWSANLDFTAAASGTVSITANHSDTAGNAANPQTRNFTKDVAAPTVAITSPAAGSAVNASNKAAFAISGTCSENGRNVVISGAGSATATCTAGAWSTSVDVSAAADGTITLYADHSDAAGNAATQASRNFTKDVAAPTVAITSPAAGTYANNATKAAFAISGTCSENGRTVTISGAGSATPTCTAGAWSASVDVSAAADGAITLYADLSDAAGNAATQASRAFNKDVVGPTVSLTAPNGGEALKGGSAYAVTWTASDAVSGPNWADLTYSTDGGSNYSGTVGSLDANTHTYSWTVPSLDSTTVKVRLVVSDAAGNITTVASAGNFTIDSTAPTVAITSPAAGSWVNKFNRAAFGLSGTCSENGRTVTISGAGSATATCTAGAWSTTVDVTAAADGTLTLYADLSDAAGNAATQASRTYNKDTNSPSGTLIAPNGGEFIKGGSTYAITYTSGDNVAVDFIKIDLSTNSGSTYATAITASTTNPTSFSWTVPSLDISTARVEVSVHDTAGNTHTSYSAADFTIDSTAPTVAISTPAAGSSILSGSATSYTVTGTCSENGRNVVITGDASATVACVAGAWTANLDFSAAAEGAVSITVNHSDAAGNTATPATRSFVKDTVAPTVAITSPANGAYITAANQAAFTISGTCSENGQAVTYDGSWASGTVFCAAGAWSTTIDFTGAANGTVTFYADHSDAAGNAATQASHTFTKDTVAPTVAITSPAAMTSANLSTYTAFAVSGTCSENGRTVTVTATHTGSTTATPTCTAGAWTANLDLTALDPDTFTVTANLSDAAGNAATPDSRNFDKDIFPPNAANPVAWSIAGPTNSTSLTAAWTKSNSGDFANEKIQFYADGTCTTPSGSLIDLASNTIQTRAFTAPGEGTFSYILTSFDAAGNSTASACSTPIVVDQTAPAAPTNLAYQDGQLSNQYTGNKLWTKSTSTDVVTQQVRSFSDGTCGTALTGWVDVGSATAESFTQTAPADGTYSFKVRAVDAAGNIGSSVCSYAITFDTVAPVLASATVTNATPTSSQTFGLTYGAITASTYASYCIRENSTAVGGCTWTAGTVPASFTVSDVNQNKTLSVWLKDAAGNVSARVDTNTVAYDNGIVLSPLTSTPAYGTGTTTIAGPRASATTILLANGDLLAVGGTGSTSDNNQITNSVLRFKSGATVGNHTWSSLAPMLTARMLPGVVELANGDVLAIGGCTITPYYSSHGTAATERYVSAENRWYKKTDMNTPRCFHSTTLLDNGKVLVVGGEDATGATLGTYELYDPTADTWTQGTFNGGATLAGMSGTKLSDGRVFFAGGFGSAGWNQTGSFIYDPTANTFTAKASMASGRQTHASTLLTAAETGAAGDTVMVFGGYAGGFLNSVEAYDVATNAWTTKASMANARTDYPNFAVNTGSGTVYVIGGTNGTPMTAVERYTWSTNTWANRASLPYTQANQIVGMLGDGTVLSAGGYGTNSTGTNAVPFVHEYDVAGNAWSKGIHLPRNAVNITSALLNDGRVLSCGGYDQGPGEYIDTCWTYDPAVNGFNGVGKLIGARHAARMMKLSNGVVAIVGGQNGGTVYASLQLFNPATNVFTTATAAPAGYINPALFALSGAKLLVAGGLLTSGGVATTNCYIYDYGTNTWSNAASLPTAIGNMAYAKTPSGKMYVHGGMNEVAGVDTFYNVLYQYNEGSDTWTTLASSTTNREWHQLTPFTSGGNEYLLAAGGDQSQTFGTVLKSAEKYDITNNTWSSAGSMATNKSIHVAYWPTGSNEIYEIGGYGGTQTAVYKYSISGNSWTTVTALNNSHYNTFTSSVPLADGRFFVYHGGGGGTYQKVAEVYSFVPTIIYTASGGVGNLVFSLTSGAGTLYEKLRMFVPPYPLTGGPSRVTVTDTNGHSVSADVNY